MRKLMTVVALVAALLGAGVGTAEAATAKNTTTAPCFTKGSSRNLAFIGYWTNTAGSEATLGSMDIVTNRPIDDSNANAHADIYWQASPGSSFTKWSDVKFKASDVGPNSITYSVGLDFRQQIAAVKLVVTDYDSQPGDVCKTNTQTKP